MRLPEGVVGQRRQQVMQGVITETEREQILRIPRARDVGRVEELLIVIQPVTLGKEAMSSKTINEFAEVQNKIAQSNFDDFMAGATKLTEISTKLITESAEPVNAQIGKAIKKASESMAA